MPAVVFVQQPRQRGVVFTQTATVVQKLKMKIAELFVTGLAVFLGWPAVMAAILIVAAVLVVQDLWDVIQTVYVTNMVLLKQVQGLGLNLAKH
jgi:hypothetical protein